jgi:hypothetical protein
MKKLTVSLAALLLFLLPLRFGSLAVMPEAGGFFPDQFIDWFFISNYNGKINFLIDTIVAFNFFLNNQTFHFSMRFRMCHEQEVNNSFYIPYR